jgi:hypothetical protein
MDGEVLHLLYQSLLCSTDDISLAILSFMTNAPPLITTEPSDE